MDQRVFPKTGHSPADSANDHEEKEISDEDDDRNHKHRRRETQSLSLETDVEQVQTRDYRNRNKPFENGHLNREADSKSSETWRNYNMNQRARGNQPWTGDPGSGRGRGRELGSWNVHDSRFSSVDFNPTIAQQGYVPPCLFAGRGMPSVSNAQSAAWSAFGLVPRLPNGGLDGLYPLGMQRTLRAPIHPSMNMGIPNQRCRDFEERGFCLRGDMCPMEHGINRIVIEDVQSLSQFNLPGSLPTAHLMGAVAGPGSLSAASAPSTLGNGQAVHSKITKAGTENDGLSTNGAAVGSRAEFYDPDQPLWTSDGTQTSTGFFTLDPTEGSRDENQAGLVRAQHIGLHSGSDNEHPLVNAGTGSHSTEFSAHGQVQSLKNRSKSSYTGNISSEYQEVDTAEVAVEHQGKMANADDIVSNVTDSSMKTINNSARFIQKPSHKAQCTLFVSGIPHKDNKRDALLTHFQKFGEVINIYIPSNSERAFVQFSKREEAEDALKAPDAVMGNRFIKLWWANRDNVPFTGISTPTTVPTVFRVGTGASVHDISAVATQGKDAPKDGRFHALKSPVLSSDHPKLVVANVPQPAMQKKVENLEYLKELRKKQEMLDKKRNDFKRALEKLEKQKQATGVNAELALEQAAKKRKVETVADVQKGGTPTSIESSSIVSSTRAEMTDRSISGGDIKPQGSNTSTMVELTTSASFKQSTRHQAPAGTPFVTNRFKLDNRPTSFMINPPLPAGLADVSALKEHFSTFGDVCNVDLEDIELKGNADESVMSNKCARVYFTTRPSAERAFTNGKCWKGHSMQFTWLTSSTSGKENSARENPFSYTKGCSDANGQPIRDSASLVSPKTTVTRDVESENLEQGDECTGHMVPDEELHSSLTPMSSEKQA